jgi:hypothetical protein
MVDPADKQTQEIDYLAMSDEDVLKMPVPDGPVIAQTTQEPEAKEQAKAEVPADRDDAGDGDEATEGAEEGAADEGKPEGDEGAGAEKEEKKPEVEAKKEGDDEGGDKEKPEEKKPDVAVDYEAEYKKLLAPFKANGREIQVKSVDDAIQLMQMGANYNRKMAALKPNLKLMKMLENNGLLSEEKLSFLIDVEKKNPAAINKLVKDSGLSPMDLDPDNASEYKASNHQVDDRELELDTVLEDLQSSPSYNRTLEVVSKVWDRKSKQEVAAQPQLLKVINSHIESGIYDLISKEVESERLFGRLDGLSDIEAYREVGDRIKARGGFDHLVQGSSQNRKETAAKPVVVEPNPKKVEDDKLKDKRRAASPTRPAAPAAARSADFNPLDLPDEEFEKLVKTKFL